MSVPDLVNFHIVVTSASGALNAGFLSFMRNASYSFATPADRYVGVGNRSVTIVGNEANEDEYITHVIPSLLSTAEKHELYQKMNMAHRTFAGSSNEPTKVDESCTSRLFSLEFEHLAREPLGAGGWEFTK